MFLSEFIVENSPNNRLDRDSFGDPSSQFPTRLPELLGGPNIKPLLLYGKGSAGQIFFEGIFEQRRNGETDILWNGGYSLW